VVEIAKKFKPQAQVKYLEGKGTISPYPAAYDDQIARRELGWNPSYTIEKAVQEHLDIVSSGLKK
jgi:nucleoside-diphosphate-sugar epimerase